MYTCDTLQIGCWTNPSLGSSPRSATNSEYWIKPPSSTRASCRAKSSVQLACHDLSGHVYDIYGISKISVTTYAARRWPESNLHRGSRIGLSSFLNYLDLRTNPLFCLERSKYCVLLSCESCFFRSAKVYAILGLIEP